MKNLIFNKQTFKSGLIAGISLLLLLLTGANNPVPARNVAALSDQELTALYAGTKTGELPRSIEALLPPARQDAEAGMLRVYPNPSRGPITFEFTISENARASLDLYTAGGQLAGKVFFQFAEANTIQKIIYNKPLDPGVYLYTLRWNGNILTGKVIVRR